MDLVNRILKLSSLSAPSGFEDEVAGYIKQELIPYMDSVDIDTLGNVVAVKKCGIDKAPRLLLDAHMDEVGFIITGVEDGFLRFSTLGGIDTRVLPASSIRVLTEPPLVGTVTCLPVHALSQDDMNRNFKIDDLRIDVGLLDEEARKSVPVGTPAVYDSLPIQSENKIFAKSLDDRACVAIILDALEQMSKKRLNLNCDLYVLISTQEEVGCRGAKTGSFAVSADYCLVLDVDHGKTPDSQNKVTASCGGGPIVSFGPNMNRSLTEKILKVAYANDVDVQITAEPSGNSGTNAAVIQVSGEGVATALLSLPLKYMHTPVECISVDDAERLSLLLEKTMMAVGGEGI